MGCTPSKGGDRRDSVNPRTGPSKQLYRSDVKSRGLTAKTFAEVLVRRNDKKIADVYDLGNATVLGKGACGSVRVVRRKVAATAGSTNVAGHEELSVASALFAMKTVRVDGMPGGRIEDLRREIDVQVALDHPNIVRVYEYFEEDDAIHIIMELCTGGALVSRMKRFRNGFQEEEAATLIEKILGAVLYCHSQGVIHRDIKLDNFIYTDKSDNAELKMIDFGFAYEVENGREGMFEQIGTPSYMAPELWSDTEQEYDSSVDMWAIGVVAYMLLSGTRPFHSGDQREKARMIREDPVVFPHASWRHVSEAGKNFIRQLMHKDSRKRLSASQALKLPWIAQRSSLHTALPEEAMAKSVDVMKALQRFSLASDMHKVAREVLAFATPPEKVEKLKALFVQLDTDNTGTLSKAEFRQALHLCEMTHEQVDRLFETVDLNESGEIDYTEFLGASLTTMHTPSIRTAFGMLDLNNDGSISISELKSVLGDEYSDDELTEMIQSVGSDEQITFDDFKMLLLSDMQQEHSADRSVRATNLSSSLNHNLLQKLNVEQP